MKLFLLSISISIFTLSLFAQNNVGIGTTSPNPEAILDLNSTDKALLLPRLNSADTSTNFSSPSVGMIFYAQDINRLMYYNGSNWNALSFGESDLWRSNGTDIYNTNSDGVGIGTSTPTGKFEVVGQNNDPAFRINDTDILLGDYTGAQFGTYLEIDPEANGEFIFANGNVGIGTPSPSEALHLGTGGIYISSSSDNMIRFSGNNFNFPTVTNRSVGTKIVLWPELSATRTDFALGVGLNTQWYSVPTSSDFHRFYGGTSEIFTITGSGNVGIGNNNPSVALDIDNGGDIEVDGEYTYETSKTRVMFVAPNAFHSNQPHLYDYATDAYSQASTANKDAGYGYFPNGAAGQAATAVAPIYLPDGARITELEILWSDSYVSANLRVSIMRKSTGSINPFTIISLTSSGSTTGITSTGTSTTAVAHTVSNNNYAYYLKYGGIQNLSSSSLALKSVKITYEVDQAD